MEFNERRVLELLLGLIFIGVLLVAVAIVLTSNPKSSTSNTISNSYNVNSYNDYSKEIPEKSVVYNRYGNVVYKKTYSDSVDYSSYGRHVKRKDFVGTYVDEFYVYVTNEEDYGNYFNVKFYFEDSLGREFSETVEKYIRAGEKVKFYFRDVQGERYRYDDWSYKVFPESSKEKVRYVIY